MKNEIDDLLTAMFRNGVLNMKKPAATPSLVWDPAEDEKKANSAVQSVECAASATTAKLQTQIDELTRQANAELTGLESALKQDGVEAVQAVNAGAPQQVDAAFLEAGHAAAEQVLGQDAFLAALGVALRRPFVVGTGEDAPLGRILVRGGTATGRHLSLIHI